MHVFRDLGTLFLDPWFYGPGRIFCWTWGHKKLGDLPVCFLDPVGIFFWTCMYLCWTQGKPNYLFLTSVYFWTRAPASWDLASIGWGGNSIVIGAHIGLDVFGPWSWPNLGFRRFLLGRRMKAGEGDHQKWRLILDRRVRRLHTSQRFFLGCTWIPSDFWSMPTTVCC